MFGRWIGLIIIIFAIFFKFDDVHDVYFLFVFAKVIFCLVFFLDYNFVFNYIFYRNVTKCMQRNLYCI